RLAVYKDFDKKEKEGNTHFVFAVISKKFLTWPNLLKQYDHLLQVIARSMSPDEPTINRRRMGIEDSKGSTAAAGDGTCHILVQVPNYQMGVPFGPEDIYKTYPWGTLQGGTPYYLSSFFNYLYNCKSTFGARELTQSEAMRIK